MTTRTSVRKLSLSHYPTIASTLPLATTAITTRGLSSRTGLQDNTSRGYPFLYKNATKKNKNNNVTGHNGKNCSSVALEWDGDDNHGDYSGEKRMNLMGNEQSQHHGGDQSSFSVSENPSPDEKHCNTCTCAPSNSTGKETAQATNYTPHGHSSDKSQPQNHPITNTQYYDCGTPHYDVNDIELPPPPPEPKYSVHKRVLPSSAVALGHSKEGRKRLLETLTAGTAESYWSLSEQFCTQSEPTSCGVTTLLVVLNSMCVDPHVRWKGPWRWYGSEEVLLDRCCIHQEKVRRAGITVDEFVNLAKCQGVRVTLHRPTAMGSNNDDNQVCPDDLQKFRNDVLRMVQSPSTDDTNGGGNDDDGEELQGPHGILVVSFSRSALGQTGEGHFSPIAAYHKETDSVLVMDVARFKYAPYWVSLTDLYKAMQPLDTTTNRPRGWFLMYPPQLPTNNIHGGPSKASEHRRSVTIVPLVGEGDVCPIGPIKIDYCSVNENQKDKRTKT